jgi:hypothetical protein
MDQLRPKTVAFKTAQLLLGGAARSTLYKWANEGKLKLVKRGNKTEAELDSIDALNAEQLRPVDTLGHSFGRPSSEKKVKTGGRRRKSKKMRVTVKKTPG